MSVAALIAGGAESPYRRHPDPALTTEALLADAVHRLLDGTGVPRDDVDGFGVASFTLGPDHAADLVWRLGLRVRWLMEDTNGGAAGINMLQHALRAVEVGDASSIVLVAGDCFHPGEFRHLVESYNRVTRDYLTPTGVAGPNALFSMLTQRHMRRHELQRSDYGRYVLAQRAWAERNPGAVYRDPLTMEEYLAAPPVAPPLHRFDCPPVVSGADALLVTSRQTSGVAVRSIDGLHNADAQEGDGLRTGLAGIAPALWDRAGFGPGELDAAYVYDDYPAMALIQLADLGVVTDVAAYLRELPDRASLPVNTSGGQLSAGQAGAAGGMHGLVEATRQLLGQVGGRQLEGARRAVVTGYGMLVHRYGACANAAVLERVGR